MRHPLTRLLMIAVVTAYFACPVFQMLDHWDHGETHGQDTESTLLMVAVAVGLTIPVAGAVFTPSVSVEHASGLVTSLPGRGRTIFPNPPIPVSEPPPVLRI